MDMTYEHQKQLMLEIKSMLKIVSKKIVQRLPFLKKEVVLNNKLVA